MEKQHDASENESSLLSGKYLTLIDRDIPHGGKHSKPVTNLKGFWIVSVDAFTKNCQKIYDSVFSRNQFHLSCHLWITNELVICRYKVLRNKNLTANIRVIYHKRPKTGNLQILWNHSDLGYSFSNKFIIRNLCSQICFVGNCYWFCWIPLRTVNQLYVFID